jgi:hypothetical protein
MINETITDRILTPEQYAQLEHHKPYIIELNNHQKNLLFYGSKHITDPSDPMFVDIKNRIATFKPQLILVGDSKPKSEEKRLALETEIRKEDESLTIQNRSDIGYVIKIALENNIAWQPLEPTEPMLLQHLLDKGFSKGEIFAFRGMQSVIQYQNISNKPDLQRYFQNSLDAIHQATNWEDFDYSISHFIKMVNDIYATEFTLESLISTVDLKNYAYPNSKPHSWTEQSIVNKIWEEAWKFRDINAISKIADALDNNERVFVIYVASHAVVQEPALRKLFELD